VRKVVYATNPIESINARLGKVTLKGANPRFVPPADGSGGSASVRRRLLRGPVTVLDGRVFMGMDG
jgi:hypothetical protein